MRRRRQSLEDLFWGNVGKPDENGCWPWIGRKLSNKKLYGFLCMSNDKYVYAHKFAYALFHGEIEEGHVLRHSCPSTLCVNPDHLYTQNRCKPKPYMRPGQDGGLNHNAKLSDAQVREIKRLLREGMLSQATIARQYGVSACHISAINAGRYWSHLSQEQQA